jgi:hypothetical protein
MNGIIWEKVRSEGNFVCLSDAVKRRKRAAREEQYQSLSVRAWMESDERM